MAGNNNSKSKKIWMHNIREKQKATALSCSLFLTALDRFSAFWVFFAAKIQMRFYSTIEMPFDKSYYLNDLLPCQYSEVLIENCTAHFPSTRNNQIDAATNQSKQVHCQTKFWPRWAWGRLCGGDPENDFKWYIIFVFFIRQIIISLLLFSGQDVLLPFNQFFLRSLGIFGDLEEHFVHLFLHSTRGLLYRTNLCWQPAQ